MKDVVIFVLSKFSADGKERINDFTDITGQFHAQTKQTNESCIKYLIWKLGKEGGGLDKAYAFVTTDEKKEDKQIGGLEGKDSCKNKTSSDFEKFKLLFPNLSMDYVKLKDGKVQTSMETIPKMYDKLVRYRNAHGGDEVRINLDITGGFRHSSMMLLTLLQLLRYGGFIIGDILYANISVKPNIVEDASSLLNFSFLIGGAEEFVSLGSVQQIQNYFVNTKPSPRLQNLLSSMTDLSETLRICGSYQITEAALLRLNDAINIYENALKKDQELDPQECYFSKLLPRIKKEYHEILPQNIKSIPPDKIIRWCLHKGLLQQAVTFYTEWMPLFFVKESISVKDNNIIEKCKEDTFYWSHWSIYLLRRYQPDSSTQGPVEDKAGYRRKIFEFLLKERLITAKISQKKLLDFVESYERLVNKIRNKFAHANSDRGVVEEKNDIIKEIEESVFYICGK